MAGAGGQAATVLPGMVAAPKGMSCLIDWLFIKAPGVSGDAGRRFAYPINPSSNTKLAPKTALREIEIGPCRLGSE